MQDEDRKGLIGVISGQNNDFVSAWALQTLQLHKVAHTLEEGILASEVAVLCQAMDNSHFCFSVSLVRLLVMLMTNRVKPTYQAMALGQLTFATGQYPMEDDIELEKEQRSKQKMEKEEDETDDELEKEREREEGEDDDGEKYPSYDTDGWVEGWTEEMGQQVRSVVRKVMENTSAPDQARLWCAYALLQSGLCKKQHNNKHISLSCSISNSGFWFKPTLSVFSSFQKKHPQGKRCQKGRCRALEDIPRW